MARRARVGAGAGQAHRRRGHEVHARRRRPLSRRRPRGHAARLLRHREGGHAAGALPHRQEAARGDPVLEGVGVDRRRRASCAARPTATRAITYGDDGEKFGVWPHTKEWVWEQGLAARLLAQRSSSGRREARSRPTHFGEYLRSHRPTGRVYLPTASYEEMGEWTLPADAQAALQRGAPGAQGSRRARARARRSCAAASGRTSSPSIPRRTTCTRRWCGSRTSSTRAEEKLAAVGDRDERSLDTRGASSIARSATAATGTACSAGSTSTICATRSIATLIERRGAWPSACSALGDAAARSIEARHRRRSAARGHPAERRGWRSYIKPTSAAACSSSTIGPSASTCSNVLGRRAEGYHGNACSRRRARQRDGGGGGPVSIHDLIAVKSAGLEELLVLRSPPAARRSSITSCRRRRRWTALAQRQLRRARRLRRRAPTRSSTRRERARPRVHSAPRGRVAGRAVTVDKTLTLDGAKLTCDLPHQRRRRAAARLTFAPELVADAARRRRARSLLPRRRARARHGRAQAGRRRGELPRGHARSSWSTSGTRFFVRVVGDAGADRCGAIPLETASQSEAASSAPTRASVIVPVWRDVARG